MINLVDLKRLESAGGVLTNDTVNFDLLEVDSTVPKKLVEEMKKYRKARLRFFSYLEELSIIG